MSFVRRFLQKSKHFFIFVFCGILFLGILYFLDAKYRVKTLTIEGIRDETIEGTETLKNRRIWMIDDAETIAYLNERNPGIKIISFDKNYPDEVIIEAKKIVGAAYLHVDSGFYLISDEGILLEKSREEPNSDRPLIEYYQKIPYSQYHLGQEMSQKDILDGLYFLKVVESSRQKVISIDIEGFNMLGLNTEKYKYFFTSEKDRELQEYLFEKSIAQMNLEGIEFKELDFRFEKPVVRF